MKAIITVVGKDKSGIIACVTELLAQKKVNIADISQTVLGDWFAMIMLVETGDVGVGELRDDMRALGTDKALDISVQHEDIFTAMHRV